jgi:glutamate synthase domain-containing protein 1
MVQTSNGVTPLGDMLVQVTRVPFDLNGDGRVDRHDLNMLARDLKQTVRGSACGAECDLDGDGQITQKDADLMSQLCDSQLCAFAQAEYAGGPSTLEPDMREVHKTEALVMTKTAAADGGSPIDLSNSEDRSAAQTYQAELKRKQSLRNIHYWYKGKPVTTGPLANQAIATSRP